MKTTIIIFTLLLAGCMTLGHESARTDYIYKWVGEGSHPGANGVDRDWLKCEYEAQVASSNARIPVGPGFMTKCMGARGWLAIYDPQ